jgi:hypothetical protein
MQVIKLLVFIGFVGLVGFLLSTPPNPMNIKQLENKSNLVKDTRTIFGKLDSYSPSALTVTDKHGTHQVLINHTTFIVWQDVDNEIRIEHTPTSAADFIKNKQCNVGVGVYKGIASDVILHPYQP